MTEENMYRFKAVLHRIPNVSSVLQEVLANTDREYPIEIVSNIELHPAEAKAQAYEGLMTEILGMIMKETDIELIAENESGEDDNRVPDEEPTTFG